MDISKLSAKSLAQVSKLVKSLESIESRTKTGQMLSYNFRFDNNQVLWAPNVGPEITQYKQTCESKLANPELDLIYRSRHSNISPLSNGFISIFGTNSTQRLVMSDYIMFNKHCELNLGLVDRFLPYCKFKVNGETKYQIDGWEYDCPGMFHVGSTKPNYLIKFSMDGYDQMKLLTSEEEKRLAVRAMIKIMNECDAEQINLENYYVISEWYYLNDHLINSYNSNIYQIDNKLNTSNALTPNSNMIIPINNLATKREIAEILYSNAINGSKDCYTFFGMKLGDNCLNNLAQVNLSTEDPIESIGMAKINIPINTQQIDLTKYAIANGVERTTQVIEQIKRLIKHRINLDEWVEIESNQPINKYELIAKLHNRLKPYGMGVLAHAERKFDQAKIREILDQNNYIDYLNGIRFKLDLSNYPILDVRRFEDTNGSFVLYLSEFAKYK